MFQCTQIWVGSVLTDSSQTFDADITGQTAPQHQSSTLCLIGFARASSDMAFAATIHNVIVHPNARHRGIGRALLRRLTSQVKRCSLWQYGVPEPVLADLLLSAVI